MNPYPASHYYWQLGMAYVFLGRWDEAIDAHKMALKREPNDFVAHLSLVICYCMIDRMEDARAEASEVLRIYPQYSIGLLEEAD